MRQYLKRLKKGSSACSILAMKSLCFILWGAVFISGQYLTIFLRSFPFVNDYILGIVMSLGSFVAAMSQMIWGRVADQSKTKNRILMVTVVGMAVGQLLLVLPDHTGFLSLLPCFFFLQFFTAIPCLMTDTIVVEGVNRLNIPFGTVKRFSSAGAASMAFVLYLISLWMAVEPSTIYLIASATALLTLIPAAFVPAIKGHAYGMKEDKGNTSMKALLKNRRLVLLLCYLLLLFVGIQSANVFMGVYFATEAGFNAGLGFYGLFFAVCIGTETLFMTLGSRFILAMNIYHVFTLVGVVACARSLVWFLAPNVYILLLNAVCQALLFAPLWTRLGPYVYSIVAKELRATGQAACGIMTGGIAPMVGAALAGFVAGSFGIRNVFGVMAVMLAVVTVVFYFLFRNEQAYFRGRTDLADGMEGGADPDLLP